MIFDGKVVAIAFCIFTSHTIHLRLQNENYYQSSVIHRVDTNASTHPMMSNFEVKINLFQSNEQSIEQHNIQL